LINPWPSPAAATAVVALFFVGHLKRRKEFPKAPVSSLRRHIYRKESKGIYAYRFDAASSALTPLGIAAEASNPSFLAIDPSHRFLYASTKSKNIKMPTAEWSAPSP